MNSIPIYLQSCVSALALYMVFRAASMRSTPKSYYYFLLAICVFFHATGYLLELDAHTLEGAYFAQRVAYYGISFYAVFFYLFVRDYANHPVNKKWQIGLLFFFPALVFILVNLYPDSHLYFRALSFELEPTAHLVITRGPFYHLHTLYSFVFLLASALEVWRNFPRSSRAEKSTRRVFYAAILPPSIVVMILGADRLQMPMQISSAVLAVSLLLLGQFILLRRAGDWLPYARELVVESIRDGFVLLDVNNCFVDANAVAKCYFPEMEALAPGMPLTDIPGFPQLLPAEEEPGQDFSLQTMHKDVWLRISVTPIHYEGQMVCRCLMFYDVSELHLLMAELEEIATHDALTGLLNRGSFFTLVNRDIDLHLRTNYEGALLMLDIDHFKRINDNYGHQAGDAVLRQVAQLLLARLRRTDIDGRYGGEEFCVFLPATGVSGALTLAEDVRKAVEKTRFQANEQQISITISIGLVALTPGRHKTLEDLIADADAALYEAKNSGRNCVVLYETAGEKREMKVVGE